MKSIFTILCIVFVFEAYSQTRVKVLEDNPNKFNMFIWNDFSLSIPSFSLNPKIVINYDRISLNASLNIPYLSLSCKSGTRIELGGTLFLKNTTKKIHDEFIINSRLANISEHGTYRTYTYNNSVLVMPITNRRGFGIRGGLMRYTINLKSNYVDFTTEDGYTISMSEISNGTLTYKPSSSMIESHASDMTYNVIYGGIVFEKSKWILIDYLSNILLNSPRSGFYMDVCYAFKISRTPVHISGEYNINGKYQKIDKYFNIQSVPTDFRIGGRFGYYSYGNLYNSKRWGMAYAAYCEIIPGIYAGNIFGFSMGVFYSIN